MTGKQADDEMVAIYETSNRNALIFIKSLLESENIAYFVQSENISRIYTGEPVRIFVPRKNAERAKEIVEQFDEDNKGSK